MSSFYSGETTTCTQTVNRISYDRILVCFYLSLLLDVALQRTLRASTSIPPDYALMQTRSSLKKKNNYLPWSIKSVCMHAGIRPCSSKRHRIKGQLLLLILFRDSVDGFSLSPDKQCLCIFITVFNLSPSICGRVQHQHQLLFYAFVLNQQSLTLIPKIAPHHHCVKFHSKCSSIHNLTLPIFGKRRNYDHMHTHVNFHYFGLSLCYFVHKFLCASFE